MSGLHNESEEPTEDDRMEVTLLGRTIGTSSGWDGDPGEWLAFYDFQPKDGIDLSSMSSLNVNWETGHIGPVDDEGEFVKGETKDLVEFLSGVKRDV